MIFKKNNLTVENIQTGVSEDFTREKDKDGHRRPTLGKSRATHMTKTLWLLKPQTARLWDKPTPVLMSPSV